MPGDDIKQYATSSHDFYELLGVTSVTSESEVRRAYRKTALKYHPDKVGNDSAKLEKFHLLQIAYEVLSDPTIKTLYDNAREARLQKQRQNELFEGKRRQMKEDLEARERGVKRRREDDRSAEEKFEMEFRRIAEDGKKRREMAELRKREKLEEEERMDKEREEAGTAQPDVQTAEERPQGGTAVPELDRTVKVRWPRKGAGTDIDKDGLKRLFETFGPVDNAFMLKDKRQRIGATKEKQNVATGVVVFASIVGAHAAVTDYKRQKGAPWDILDSVAWAGNSEQGTDQRPSSPAESAPSDSAPSTPAPSSKRPKAFPGIGSATVTPERTPATNGNGLKKVPSFASFSAAAFSTPKGSPSANGFGPNSPSLEEITMIRLKNAERRRLEEQIQRQDEAADVAEKA